MWVNIYDQRLFGASCQLPVAMRSSWRRCCPPSWRAAVAAIIMWFRCCCSYCCCCGSNQSQVAKWIWLGIWLNILHIHIIQFALHLFLLGLHLQVSPSMRQWNAAWRTAAPIPVAVPMALSIAVRRVWRVCPLRCRTIQPNCKWACQEIPISIYIYALTVHSTLFLLQSPGAELHYGAAGEILFQLPTLATHWSLQQQHLEDCTRCAKWPQAANNAVSRRALATSSTL